MKKIYFLLSVMTILMANSIFGQNYPAYINYQLPKCYFDEWISNDSTSLPVYWYSYSNLDCEMSGTLCATALAAGLKRDHHRRVVGYTGTESACQLYTVNILTYNLNGALTTGKSVVHNPDFTSSENYVYTERNGTCHWIFLGRPDSIAI